MEKLLSIMLLLFVLIACQKESNPEKVIEDIEITYEIHGEEYPGFKESKEVKAIIGTQTYNVQVAEEGIPINIYEIRDFDNNGYDDALIEVVNGYGGNCCANSYFFVSAFPENRFSISKTFGYDWDGPEINFIDDKWVLEVDESSAGFNNELDLNVKTMLYLSDGEINIIKTTQEGYLDAVKEIKASDFETKDEISLEGETIEINYDLNGDGYLDKIICGYWERWGMLHKSVIVDGATDKVISNFENIGMKRIGVLETKTNGYNDIIIDASNIIKWNGNAYIYNE